MHGAGLLFRPIAGPAGYRPHPVSRLLHRQHLSRLAMRGLSSFPLHLSGHPAAFQSNSCFCFFLDLQRFDLVESHYLVRKASTHLAQFSSLH